MTESFKFYEVGGKIRDEFLGIKSKDVDYVAVPSKEVCKARFKGNWKLKITDYSNSNLDDEVLISEL